MIHIEGFERVRTQEIKSLEVLLGQQKVLIETVRDEQSRKTAEAEKRIRKLEEYEEKRQRQLEEET